MNITNITIHIEPDPDEAGSFGVWASADLLVLLSEDADEATYVMQRIRSPGIWDVDAEPDLSDPHIRELANEELTELALIVQGLQRIPAVEVATEIEAWRKEHLA